MCFIFITHAGYKLGHNDQTNRSWIGCFTDDDEFLNAFPAGDFGDNKLLL